jgi:xanthine dehydrogenase YagS FAD-binding subunit
MYSFTFERAGDPGSALRAFGPDASYLAGGTTLLDLMKLEVMRPEVLIDVNALRKTHADISMREGALHLGAFARMADAAANPLVLEHLPMLAQTLQLAASPQLRNMATLGGNVLQRTRCSYFRDPSWTNCNKRNPGSGCAALEGVNRKHAVLGVSDACIAAYPGDFAQALIAMDASVEVAGAGGRRAIPFETLHREPGDRPDWETNLKPGELIEGFVVPIAPWSKRSLYLKIRDRQSYEFALTSAAVALDLQGDVIREARIALGGVATRPWRARDAEAQLAGKPASDENFRAAADAAFAGARTREGNRYKVELGKRTLARALAQAAEMRI